MPSIGEVNTIRSSGRVNLIRRPSLLSTLPLNASLIFCSPVRVIRSSLRLILRGRRLKTAPPPPQQNDYQSAPATDEISTSLPTQRGENNEENEDKDCALPTLINPGASPQHEPIRQQTIGQAETRLKGFVVIIIELLGPLIHIPAQAVIEGQLRCHPPLILRKERIEREAAPLANQGIEGRQVG